MGLSLSPATITILQNIHAAGSMSIAEMREVITDPLIDCCDRMSGLARKGFLSVEGEKKDRRYSLNDKGLQSIGELPEPPQARDETEFAIATTRQHSFGIKETYVPPEWQGCAGTAAYLSARGIAA